MKANRILLLAVALTLPVGSLFAQNDGPPPGDNGPGPGGPRHGHRPPPMPLIEALDTNHDGVISADEIANASKALLTLDKNGDGQLTRDELMPARPPRPGANTQPGTPPAADGTNSAPGRPPRPLPPIVAALDTNHDGVISADEIANAPKSLLTLDKNGDGQLTRDELRPQGPPPRFDGPGGPDDGQRPPPPGEGGPDDGQGPPPPSPEN